MWARLKRERARWNSSSSTHPKTPSSHHPRPFLPSSAGRSVALHRSASFSRMGPSTRSSPRAVFVWTYCASAALAACCCSSLSWVNPYPSDRDALGRAERRCPRGRESHRAYASTASCRFEPMKASRSTRSIDVLARTEQQVAPVADDSLCRGPAGEGAAVVQSLGMRATSSGIVSGVLSPLRPVDLRIFSRGQGARSWRRWHPSARCRTAAHRSNRRPIPRRRRADRDRLRPVRPVPTPPAGAPALV